MLLDQGADVKVGMGAYGKRVLMGPSGSGHEAGADVEANVKVNECMTPLSKAAKNGHRLSSGCSLDKGANFKI